MKKSIFITSALCILVGATNLHAENYISSNKKTDKNEKPSYTPAEKGNDNSNALLAGCASPNAATYIEFNNIKAMLYTGGDMFWDFGKQTASFEIPKGSGKHSMFLASLWLGGTDLNGHLRIAAQRFRQSGVDFWTGPLNTQTAEISPDVCAEWDKHFIITRQEVNDFVNWFDNPSVFPNYSIPNSILEWPAHGDPSKGQAHFLAPFFDYNGDGYYNPLDGDYPYYDLATDGDPYDCHGRDREPLLFGDQTFWYIINDKGNIHKETEGDAIGLEIHAQTFAFATNDEINNMLFSNYRIINRSSYTLTETYFGTNFDPDIGDAKDDYIGCDVKRGLGYGYNADAVDGTGNPGHYGENPPAIGVDFFEGPFQDPDGLDNPQDPNGSGITVRTQDFTNPCEGYMNGSINGLNFGDTVIDNERWGMRRLIYYTNGEGEQGDPQNAVEYYNYLRGYWKNGDRMTYGGTGYSSSNLYADFMFSGAQSNPQHTDECNWGVCADKDGNNCGITPNDPTPWTEIAENTDKGDRRFVHSAGPFTLEPGAENDITVGTVWARATSTDPFQSVELLRLADDKAQALFDNCFKVLNGPDAPELTAQELDQEIILSLSNPKSSNNYLESYIERDPNITNINDDPFYRFQGYQVYQLKDKTVSVADLHNIELARLVAQADIQDEASMLINLEYNEITNVDVATIMVDGNNEGISHSFQVKEDLFALGDKKLINHKKYYFIAVSYAYNQNEDNTNKKPYLGGRKNGFGATIEPIMGIPHIPSVEENGTQLNSQYGDCPEITRIEGQGNGGLVLDLTESTVNTILEGTQDPSRITYKKGAGPIEIKVVDPLKVKKGKYYLQLFNDPNDNISITNLPSPLPNALEAGESYFEVGDDIRDKMFIGHKFTISDSEGNDGEWTIFDISDNGTKIYVEERILDKNISGTINPFYKWVLLDASKNDTIAISKKGINWKSEQIIDELGISITAEQVSHPGPTYAVSDSLILKDIIQHGAPSNPMFGETKTGKINNDHNNGLLEITMNYEDPKINWLKGVNDNDIPGALNWIRAGTYADSYNQATGGNGSDYAIKNDTNNPVNNVFEPNDEYEVYENLLGGLWAPGRLTSIDTLGPMFNYKATTLNTFDELWKGPDRTTLSNLASVDLVITSDKNKWTRAVVLELGENPTHTQPLGSNVPKLGLRAGASVDKNGIPFSGDINNTSASNNPNDPNYIANTGMGWFPGYAINVETGERLNIMFGEDSWLINGNDMIWNPTSDLTNPTGQASLQQGSGCVGCAPEDCTPQNPCLPLWAGGKHYIYIMGHNGDEDLAYTNNNDTLNAWGDVPAYDAGEHIRKSMDGNPSCLQKESIFKDVMWVGLPLLHEDFQFNNPSEIPTDVTVRFRVAKSYSKNYSTKQTIALNPLNNNNPMYEFSLDDLATVSRVDSIAKNELDIINVVPNPYHAFSAYEENQIDQRVKITNLPIKCTISIYTVNGNLVRQFERVDNMITSVDWDLKNSKNVPIASGVYLIHIQAPGIGERVVKWFGVLRPTDLDSF